MTNTNAPADADRFDLIELDLPTAPRPAQPSLITPPAPTPVVVRPTICQCERPGVSRFRSETDRTRVCSACNLPWDEARAAARRAAQTPTTRAQSNAATAAAVVQGEGVATALRTQTVTQLQTRTAAQLVTTEVVRVETPALKKGDIVAGAVAEGHGVLVGFAGRGQLTRAQLLSTLTGAGFPESWAPAAKTAHAHAGRVVGSLNVLGYIARADRTKAQARAAIQGSRANAIANTIAARALPTWVARWNVSRTGRGADVGGSSGVVVAVVTLTSTGALEVRTDAEHVHLAEKIRTDFTALVDGEIYAAADVTMWLKGVLVQRFRAAKLGGNWYVKRASAGEAEKLLTAFSAVWGEDFLLPALPVATSDQLRSGIAASFAKEVDTVLAAYRTAREEAAAEKKLVSNRLSLSILSDLRELTDRCVGYAALLGRAYVETLRTKVVTASEEIQQTVDGMSQRFGLIFDELRWEADHKAQS